tara:strand:- start:197 stop:1120 length:924 start_codon:yes stop_codon:yes gene_type:complete
MIILSINISHNPSVCVYENNKIIEFYNEERFVCTKDYVLNSKFKIFQCILQKIKHKPDFVCYASFGMNSQYFDYSDQEIINVIQKQLNNPPYYFNIKEHHLYHAICSFYFSSFKEAAAIVVDGGGACNYHIPFQEIESIYLIDKKKIAPVYKHHTCYRTKKVIQQTGNSFATKSYLNGFLNKFSDETKGGIDFIEACEQIGYPDGNSAGKVMGLSSYGYTEKKYNLDYDKVQIAKEAQEKTFKDTCDLIDQAKEINNNIVLSGGYFLNCSNNFKYVEKYPNLNFFVDPIPHDGGTAIGAALYYDNYK